MFSILFDRSSYGCAGETETEHVLYFIKAVILETKSGRSISLKDFYGVSRNAAPPPLPKRVAPFRPPKAKGYMTVGRRSRISVGTILMVYWRAHLFVAGHTFYWCTADRRRFRMRDEMASGNPSSVIYDAPHRTGASIVTAKVWSTTFHEFIAIHLRAGIASSRNA